MALNDFLVSFSANVSSDTVGATVVTVKSLIKKIMDWKHSRDNYHQFRDILNVMRSHLMEMQSSTSQYHTQVSPAIERCTKQLMPVLEEARTRFPEDLPSLLGSLTLHSKMEEVKTKLEAGFKELDSILTTQDLINRTALRQPRKPLMQPEPETGFIGDVIKTKEKRILELIRRDNPARIIVVHGLGGVGKTTILHKVYNSVIQESKGFSFSSKSWLTIFQEYNMAKLQRTLAADVGMQVKDIEDEERLKMRLADSFKTRKFFVVLDNLWSEDFDVRKLGLVFGNGNQGSKVVITTRYMSIARNMGVAQFTEHIEVPTLNEEDSWELFRLWSFGSLDTGSVSGETLNTAEAVCKERNGLPLAIKDAAVSFPLDGTLTEQQSFLRHAVLPKYVVIQINHEGKDLSLGRRRNNDGNMYLPFNDDDGEIWEVVRTGENGVVKMKHISDSNSFWASPDYWVWTQFNENAGRMSEFMALRQDNGSTVALKCMGNDRFIKMCRHGSPSLNKVMIADEAGISYYCKFTVKEPVRDRRVYNLVYNTAGVSPKTSNVLLAEGHESNTTASPANVVVTRSYDQIRTSSWNNSMSLSTGPVLMSVDTGEGVPTACSDGLQIQPWMSRVVESVKWGQSVTDSTIVDVSDSVNIPAGKTIKFELFATLAEFQVPFTYTKADTLTNGISYTKTKSDGVFHTANYYGLRFKFSSTPPTTTASTSNSPSSNPL